MRHYTLWRKTRLASRAIARTHRTPRAATSPGLRAAAVALSLRERRRAVAGWLEVGDGARRTYFYQPGSQGTQWERPTDDAAHAAQDTLRDVFAAFEEARGATTDFFEPQLKDGELVLDLGPKGQYSLSQVAGQQQIMLFSPISGPQMYRFDADNGWWANELDGHLLNDLLVREIMHITSVYLNL